MAGLGARCAVGSSSARPENSTLTLPSSHPTTPSAAGSDTAKNSSYRPEELRKVLANSALCSIARDTSPPSAGVLMTLDCNEAPPPIFVRRATAVAPNAAAELPSLGDALTVNTPPG